MSDQRLCNCAAFGNARHCPFHTQTEYDDRPTADLAAHLESDRAHHRTHCPRWWDVSNPDAPCHCCVASHVAALRVAARPADGEDHELVTMRRAQLEAAESLLGFVADNKPIGPTGRNLASEMRDKFRAALAASPEGASE